MGFIEFHVYRDADEREALIALVERAQILHGRPVRSAEVLAAATPAELALMPDSSRGMCRALERHVYQSGLFGRTLRRARRKGHAEWAVYVADDALHWASTAKLHEQLAAIQAEITRRAREERRPSPQPTTAPEVPNAV